MNRHAETTSNGDGPPARRDVDAAAEEYVAAFGPEAVDALVDVASRDRRLRARLERCLDELTGES